MAIHDWTRVHFSIFHSFHLGWVSAISGTLNNGILPDRYYALSETLINEPNSGYVYAVRGVAVRHVKGDRLVAMVQVVSPESKSDKGRLNAFVRKIQQALAAGIHLLLIDLHPPGPFDHLGIHGAFWAQETGKGCEMPPDKVLTLASYVAGPEVTAYLEPVAVGDAMPDMPLFQKPDWYVSVPLEATYQTEWRGMPKRWRSVLEPPPQPPAAS